MRSKATILMLLVALGMAMAGCGAAPMFQPVGLAPVRARQSDAEDMKAYQKAMELVTALKYQEAVGEFVTLVRSFRAAGDDAQTAKAIFWAGFCYQKLKRHGTAAEYYSQVMRHHPNTREAELAKARRDQLPAEYR